MLRSYSPFACATQPTKQFGLYMTWTNRLVEEFFVQGDQEKALGLPITPIMNRAAPIPTENLQAGFIKAIVLPLCVCLADAVPHDLVSLHPPLPLRNTQYHRAGIRRSIPSPT